MSNHIAGVELDIVEPSMLWTDHLAILRVSICLYTWLLVTEMTYIELSQSHDVSSISNPPDDRSL